MSGNNRNTNIPLATLEEVKALVSNALLFLQIASRQNLGEKIPIVANTVHFEMKKRYPYKRPRLIDHKNDMSKQWHLEYYQWSFITGKLKRIRYYTGFNEIKSLTKRQAYAERLIREIMSLLPYSYEGVDPELMDDEVIEKPTQISTKIENPEKFCRKIVNELYINHKGYNNYSSIARKWYTWVDELASVSTISSFKKVHAQAYVDYLYNTRKQSPVTVRTNINKLKSIFNKGLKREYVAFNPFLELDMPALVVTKQNMAYSETQIKQIQKIATPFMWLICQFIYYTYIRPIEITRLKVGDVRLSENKIIISSLNSKNNKTQFIVIPQELKKQLLLYGIEKFPQTHYLFSKFEEPSEIKLSKNYLSKEYRKILDQVDYDKNCTLYSWKHTGVVAAYKNGVDIKSIQLQCRHSSIAHTDTYLKSLGFLDNDEFKEGIPTI